MRTLSTDHAELIVRGLRDAIYGRASDEGWNACKENWMKPENVAWLQERVKLRGGIYANGRRIDTPPTPTPATP